MVARPRPPHGALLVRVVSTAPAPKGDGRRESVCARRRGGVAESSGAAGGGWCAVSGQTRGDRGCLIGIKSDVLIRTVTLTNVDFRAGPGQSRVEMSDLFSHNSFICQ